MNLGFSRVFLWKLRGMPVNPGFCNCGFTYYKTCLLRVVAGRGQNNAENRDQMRKTGPRDGSFAGLLQLRFLTVPWERGAPSLRRHQDPHLHLEIPASPEQQAR